MKTALIGVGLPGVGKTFFLKELASQIEAVYVCPDDIRQELAGDPGDQSRNSEVWREAYHRVQESLEAGKDVVVDATNVRLSDRLSLIAHCRQTAARVNGVWFQAPYEVCLARNNARDRVVPEAAILRMACLLEEAPPSLTDGFDSLEIVNTFRG